MPARTPGAWAVQIEHLQERIRDLCERAKTAKESEVAPILTELLSALREHPQYVRYMAVIASSRSPKNTSSTKAAD